MRLQWHNLGGMLWSLILWRSPCGRWVKVQDVVLDQICARSVNSFKENVRVFWFSPEREVGLLGL